MCFGSAPHRTRILESTGGKDMQEKPARPTSVAINCQICLDYDQCPFSIDSGLSQSGVYSCLFQLIAIPRARMMLNHWTGGYPHLFLTPQGLRQGADGRIDGNRFGPQLPLYQGMQYC